MIFLSIQICRFFMICNHLFKYLKQSSNTPTQAFINLVWQISMHYGNEFKTFAQISVLKFLDDPYWFFEEEN